MNTSIPNELLDEIHDHLSDYAAAMRAVCVDAEYARLDGVAGRRGLAWMRSRKTSTTFGDAERGSR